MDKREEIRVPFVVELNDIAFIDLSKTAAFVTLSSGLLRRKPVVRVDLFYRTMDGCKISELKEKIIEARKPERRYEFDANYGGINILHLPERTIIGFSEEYIFDVDENIIKRAELESIDLGRKRVEAKKPKIEFKGLSLANIIFEKLEEEYAIVKLESSIEVERVRVPIKRKSARILNRPQEKISLGELSLSYEADDEKLKEKLVEWLTSYYHGYPKKPEVNESISFKPSISGIFLDKKILHIVLGKYYNISINGRAVLFSLPPFTLEEELRIEAMRMILDQDASEAKLVSPLAALILIIRDILEDAFTPEFLGDLYDILNKKLSVVVNRLKEKLKGAYREDYLKYYFYIIFSLYVLRNIDLEDLERSLYNAIINIFEGRVSDIIDEHSIHEVLEGISPKEADEIARAFSEAMEVLYKRGNKFVADVIGRAIESLGRERV